MRYSGNMNSHSQKKEKQPVYIRAFPALNGDCILISYTKEQNHHLLIDCGYADTYKNHLKKHLQEMGKRNERLDRFIITHIDSDHINGAVPLLKEAGDHIQIDQVWHNSYRHIQTEHPAVISANSSAQERIFQQIKNRGYKTENPTGPAEIAAWHGTTVGALLLKGKYSWNTDFNEQAVSIENKQTVAIAEAVNIYLLSPDSKKLQKLEKVWKEELEKLGLDYSKNNEELFDDAFEMMLSWEKEHITPVEKTITASKPGVDELLKTQFKEDTTATNGSSIAFILEIQDKRLLLLGDSHPSLIESSLQKYQPDGKIYFDLIKVSHHGSYANTSPSLLAKIDSPVYLISTNGQGHGHPDIATIAHIISRPSSFERVIYFNYKTANAEYFNNSEWKKKYNYSIKYLDNDPFTIIV